MENPNNSGNLMDTNPPPTYNDAIQGGLKELDLIVASKMKAVNKLKKDEKKLDSKIKVLQEDQEELRRQSTSIMNEIRQLNNQRNTLPNNYL